MMSRAELSTVFADRDWWRRVGEIIGSKLYGFTYRNVASFVEPEVEVTGKVATVLLDQQAEIKRFQAENATLRRRLEIVSRKEQ